MKYIIGIEGGATKSTCILADLKGNALFKCEGGPTNFLVYGKENVSENLFKLIEKSVQSQKTNTGKISSIVIGTAGAGREKIAAGFEEYFIKYCHNVGIGINSFKVLSDAIISLEAAFEGGEGSILISGTGSIMMSKDRKGNVFRVGGFGRLIGDEGSGYSIGRKGLKAVSKFFDGRGDTTLISKLIANHFKITSIDEFMDRLYKDNLDIASVAQHVIYASKKGDLISMRIINEEINELLLHIKAMLKKMETTELEIVLLGGILSKENYFTEKFKKKISEEFKGVKIKEPKVSPTMGAVLIAKKLAQTKI